MALGNVISIVLVVLAGTIVFSCIKVAARADKHMEEIMLREKMGDD